jgi:Cu/Ag efflux pump CusA
VQEVIGSAIGGRDAGVVFEGDRYFEIVVRLPETTRNDLDALKNLPVSLPTAGAVSLTVPLGRVATFTLGEGPNQVSRENGKRRVVVTANVRDRDIASVVNEARAQIDAQVRAAGRLLDDVGWTVREPGGGPPAIVDRGPRVLPGDLPAADERTGLRTRCPAGI